MGVASPSARSTPLRYPSISLAEAIQKVRGLYNAAHQRRMPRGELAQNLGYTTLNGASIGLISNLSRYGLLEGRGDSVRVSDLAVVLLVEPRESRERQAAIRRAAASPEIFEELNDDFQGAPQPTENSVRIRLERKGFPRKQAEIASRAYCETLALVSAEGGAYNEPQVAEEEGDPGGSMQHQPAIAPKVAPAQAPAPVIGDPGVLLLQIAYRGAPLIVRIEAQGQKLTKAHLERVGAYLKLAESDFDEEGGNPPGPAPS